MNIVDKVFGIKSRFTPQSENWFEDLPPKAQAALLQPNADGVYNALNGLDENVLEMSRASSKPKGGGVFGGIGTGIMVAGLLGTIIYTAPILWREAIWLWLFFIFLLLLVIPASIWLFRTDLSQPTDQPIRFNRATRKVYVYSMKEYYNPFGKWLPEIKAYDWDSLEAQITKTRVATVRSVGARYNLEIVQVSPSNPNEIVERCFALEAGDISGGHYTKKWVYVCNFMEHGTSHLPQVAPRPRQFSFKHNLFSFNPFIAPGAEGAAARRELIPDWHSPRDIFETALVWLTVILVLPVTPFLLSLGLCSHIALKYAPAPQWPNDIVGPKDT